MSKPPDARHTLQELRREAGGTADIVPPGPRPTPSQPPTDVVPVTPRALRRASGGCLVHIYPRTPTLGRRYPLGDRPVTIGRSDECTVRAADPSVSRAHARVELQPDGQFRVADLGSTNGTFVNDVRTAAMVLLDGDILRVGNCRYRFLTGGNLETEYHEETHRLAVTDPLTGAYNRWALMEFLDREVPRAVRHAHPLSLLMIDLDRFKEINDRLGHVAGDVTLRTVAERLKGSLRAEDLLARYGGEEFALALPETTPEQAVRCGERLRATVADTPFDCEGQSFPVTVSVGVGTVHPGEEVTPAELIRRADARLSEAKREGRNCVR